MGKCKCCEREGVKLTQHHLIPKSEFNKYKEKYGKDKLRKMIVYVCRPCHNQIHALFDNKTLAREYKSIELLKNNPDIQKWISFISTKPPSFSVKVKKSK